MKENIKEIEKLLNQKVIQDLMQNYQVDKFLKFVNDFAPKFMNHENIRKDYILATPQEAEENLSFLKLTEGFFKVIEGVVEINKLATV